jgi:hypothetical protein
MYVRFLLVACSIATIASQVSKPSKPVKDGGRLLLPRPDVLRYLAVGHQAAMSDYFFVQQLQQVALASTASEYLAVVDIARVCIAMDPDFRQPYLVAALNAPFNEGKERWKNTAESTAILRQAVERFPNDSKLDSLLAFNLTFFMRNYTEAAAIFARLADKPGAPSHYRPLSVRLTAQGGQLDKAEAIAAQLGADSTDTETQRFYQQRAKEIALERVLREVDNIAARFAQDQGRKAQGVNELLVAGYLSTFPIDPLGGRIYLDKTGTARSSSRWYRYRLYETQKKIATEEAAGPEKEFVPLIDE